MRRRAFLGVVGTTSVTGCMGYTITREDYEQRLAAQNETIDELNEIIDDFEIQVADQSEQIDALEAEISTKESQLSSLENELSAAESDTDELESEISALEGELADAESDIDGLEAEIITLEEELSAVESERDTLESEVNELESEIDDLEETIKQLEPERDFSDGTIEQATNMALDLRGGVVYLQDHESSATGIHLGGGEYLTVAHAFTGFSFSWERSGKTIDGETFSWEKEEVESGNDLRLVSSDTSLSGSIDISDSAEPVPDEPVVIIGHPFNVGFWITSIGRYYETRDTNIIDADHIVMTAPTRQGNSGGPAFNLDGEFLGMCTHRKLSWDEFDGPEDPFFSFAEYQPYVGAVPANIIQGQLTIWGV